MDQYSASTASGWGYLAPFPQDPFDAPEAVLESIQDTVHPQTEVPINVSRSQSGQHLNEVSV